MVCFRVCTERNNSGLRLVECQIEYTNYVLATQRPEVCRSIPSGRVICILLAFQKAMLDMYVDV